VSDILTTGFNVVDDKCASMFIKIFGHDICLQIHGSALCRVLRERFEETWKKARVIRLKTNHQKVTFLQ